MGKLHNLILTIKDAERELSNDGFLKAILSPQQEKIPESLRGILYDGRKPDYSEIIPKYKPFTIKMKRKKGQVSSRVTLKDTGALYKSIKCEIDDDGLHLFSDNSKTKALSDKYGDIVAIPSKDIIIENARNEFRKRLIKCLLRKR